MDTPEKSFDAIENIDSPLTEAAAVTAEVAGETETETTEETATADEADNARQRFADAPAVVIELQRLSELEPDEVSREDVNRLRHIYNTLRKNADDAALAQYIADGGDPTEYAADPQLATLDNTANALVELIKQRKNERAAQIEAEKQRNYDAKEALIAEITEIAKDADNVNRHFQRLRDIQAEFKAIGAVDERVTTDQWKRYQAAVENFYDQLKVNRELRDYDFRKNLDTKLHLCDEAETLVNEEDVVVAMRRINTLREKWRETGPVDKEVREEIWNRFSDACSAVGKRHQAYFEERKARETANEEAKAALCARLEAIDTDAIKSFNAWNEATAQVIAAQEEWKQLGFASKKVNNQLFSRFRAAADRFFEAKGNYYRTVKEDLSENLAKKTALVEEAEQLAQSTDWKKTADRLQKMQEEWRAIGAVPKKQSDAIWTRFRAACDTFFERKKKDLTGLRQSEQANLKAKKAITASLRQLPEDADRDTIQAAIQKAQADWNEVGHVPFRDKDKIYDEFRSVINELYRRHGLNRQRAATARFEESLKETDANRLTRERERLARILESKRQELVTYQNNLGFLSVKSAGGSSLLRDIERRSQRISDDIADLENKIRLIDERL